VTRFLFSAFAILLVPLAACTQSYDSTLQADVRVEENIPVAAVLVFAEWCPSCKVLDPKVEAARTMLEDDAASFVVLDYTDRDADAFFAQADAAGVGEPVRALFADGVKTGQLLLIDVENQSVIDTITRQASIEDIRERIVATQP
tara:strand:- start:1033 stop:1467 length:435 start_codon:yes stop_codon:yes gene_type:complete